MITQKSVIDWCSRFRPQTQVVSSGPRYKKGFIEDGVKFLANDWESVWAELINRHFWIDPQSAGDDMKNWERETGRKFPFERDENSVNSIETYIHPYFGEVPALHEIPRAVKLERRNKG